MTTDATLIAGAVIVAPLLQSLASHYWLLRDLRRRRGEYARELDAQAERVHAELLAAYHPPSRDDDTRRPS
jgi:hypothetical protein